MFAGSFRMEGFFMEQQQFKDAKWVADTFDLPLQRVYELTRRKVIPAVQILRQYRYDPQALAEWAKHGGTFFDGDTSTEQDRVQRS